MGNIISSLKAVILCAGMGRRTELNYPKVLAEVNGLTLLERHIIGMNHSFNITQFVIVTGYKANIITEFVQNRNQLDDFEISFAHNTKYDNLGNGYSIYMAKKAIEANELFILVYGDLFVDYSKIQMLDEKSQKTAVMAIIDRNPLYLIPGNSSVKLKINNENYITNFAMSLECYDARNIGFYRCHARIFKVIEECLNAEIPKSAWIDIVNIMANKGEVFACDCSGITWINNNSPSDLQRTHNLLLQMENKLVTNEL